MPDGALADAAGGSPVRSGPAGGALLGCLEIIAPLLGRPYDAKALAHLPLDSDGRLTPQLFERAASALGLKAQIVPALPSHVSDLVVPFVALLEDEDACVVTAAKDAQAALAIVSPPAPGEARLVEAADLDRHATGYVIYVSRAERDDAPDATASTSGGVDHWLLREVVRHWRSLIQIVIAATAINLLGLAFPLFTMNVYDRVIPNAALTTLWSLTVGVGAALLFDLALRQLRAQVLDQIGSRVDLRISAGLFEHMQAVRMAARSEPAGAIAHRLREFDTARDFFTSASIVAVIDLLFAGLFIWVLWLIVGPIALAPLLALLLVVAVTLALQVPLSRAVQRAQTHAGNRHTTLFESLAGIETIKATGAEGVMQRRWETAVAANTKAGAAVRFWSQLALNFTSTVQQAVGISIIVWGVYLVADGTITVGALVAANILSGRVLAPLANIAMTLARAQQAFAAMRGITGLLALERDGAGPVVIGQTVERGAIELADVGFAYPGSQRQVLAGISLKVQPGERIGIVGRVGSGKTTIDRLLAGLHAPTTGTVLIDGCDTRSYHPAALRQGVGLLGQEAELFTGSLRDNIVMGRPTASVAEIEEAVRLAGVDAIAARSPLGLSMQVGERGKALSGGQRQAVAFARAILRRPRVLFLDEPSSALDMSSETELIRRIKGSLQPGQTLLVCSHRMPMLELVDRLVVLDAGRIVADGPKAKVLAALAAAGGASGPEPRTAA